ncbi:MAG: protease SohB [Gammaproteobacteria bacterium]|nr:protease SohB [Gammaproteobacteria bacterium]
MTEFLFQYGLFLAKAVTFVAAAGATTLVIVALSRKGSAVGHLTVEKLNNSLRELTAPLRQAALSKAEWKKESKREEKQRKAAEKSADKAEPKPRVFVIDFKGDIRATAVSSLREEITAVVSLATARDEVVLRLENFGGAVHEHGLAASQLARLRSRGIPLTAIVDKGAASGGYMMACVANRIIAAPFAVVGSIGVIAQIPNFNRALTDRGVDFEQVTAGKYKRTVTMFGRNTEEDRAKLREELEEVHALFKNMVVANRPQLDIEAVATGEHWYGTRALELRLIDELGSSDDYLLAATERADVFHVTYKARHSLQERLLAAVRAAADQVELWIAQRQKEGSLP